MCNETEIEDKLNKIVKQTEINTNEILISILENNQKCEIIIGETGYYNRYNFSEINN